VELRETFDTVAEQYERARPMYPDELVDELVAVAGLDDRSRVLEIGCGTGQLTRALVARGVDVTCVEAGAHMAEIARRTVPDARIVVSRFEDWSPDATYDAVCCATAWHWLDPTIAPAKAHALLRPGGVLAVIGTHHVCPPDTDPFFFAIQEAYAAIGEGVDDLPGPEDIRHDDAVALRATGLFDVRDRGYLRVVEYDADAYVDVLGTYSGHIAMTDAQRQTIFDAVRRLAGDRVIRKHHLFCLHLATRLG
jgi:SAM-dependent methyltransferase